MGGPLLTLKVHEALRAAEGPVECSLDLGKTKETVDVDAAGWTWRGGRYPWLDDCKDRTVYFWDGERFEPVQRYTNALAKLVPTEWGPPTFEIDGIKMLPTEHVSPYADAQRKAGLIRPRGKTILDTCAGLGYLAACCRKGGARHVLSFEKNSDVIWLRELNPWSPGTDEGLTLTHADVTTEIATVADACVDAILHDPPRFGIAGELYSQSFYDQLARVLRRRGRLFHYTGSPNKLTTGRDVPNEVAKRLRRSGFATELNGDGVLATKIS